MFQFLEICANLRADLPLDEIHSIVEFLLIKLSLLRLRKIVRKVKPNNIAVDKIKKNEIKL